MGAQTDTRSRIQEVALRLFTEQGYEATSLREIAEALGVTKAALYYHFKTKEEIVASLAADRMTFVEDLIEWASRQPRTAETRREIVRRYSAEMAAGHRAEFMRFMERNQTALRGQGKLGTMRDLMATLIDLMCEPDDPLTIRLKRSMAMLSMHAVWFVGRGPDISDEARSEAALSVALELIDSSEASEASGA